MSKYIKKSERAVKAALEALQADVDNASTPHDRRQQSATAILDYARSQSKLGPVQAKLAENIKALTKVKSERDSLAVELEQVKAALTALESSQSELTSLQAKVESLTTAKAAADQARHVADQECAKAKLSVEALLVIFPKEKWPSVAARLFFQHKGKLGSEFYRQLGLDSQLWMTLDLRLREREQMLLALERESLDADERAFATAKLKCAFDVDAKAEIIRRADQRKAQAEAEEAERIARAEERHVAEVSARQSIAREEQMLRAEQPQRPTVVTWSEYRDMF